MKIVSMKVDRDSAEERAEATMPEENPFPYGLCLNLDEDAMEKLGLDEPLPVGTKCVIEARAVVTATRDNESLGGKDCGMSIQIVAMGIEPDKKSAANTLYGDDDEG